MYRTSSPVPHLIQYSTDGSAFRYIVPEGKNSIDSIILSDEERKQLKKDIEEMYRRFDNDKNFGRYIPDNVKPAPKDYTTVARTSKMNARGRSNRKSQRQQILDYTPPVKPDIVERFDDYLRDLKEYAIVKEEPPALENPYIFNTRREITEGSYPNWTVDELKLPRLLRY